MDFGIILGDIPTTVSEKDHFDSILRQVEAAQRAGMNHILMGQHFIFERSRWLQPVPVLARLAGVAVALVLVLRALACAGLRAGARVLDVLDVRDVLAALPLDFLAATPSDVTAMPTPSGPQRRDAVGQCPRADSSALCLCQPGCQPAFARTVHRLLLRYSCDVIPVTDSAPG